MVLKQSISSKHGPIGCLCLLCLLVAGCAAEPISTAESEKVGAPEELREEERAQAHRAWQRSALRWIEAEANGELDASDPLHVLAKALGVGLEWEKPAEVVFPENWGWEDVDFNAMFAEMVGEDDVDAWRVQLQISSPGALDVWAAHVLLMASAWAMQQQVRLRRGSLDLAQPPMIETLPSQPLLSAMDLAAHSQNVSVYIPDALHVLGPWKALSQSWTETFLLDVLERLGLTIVQSQLPRSVGDGAPLRFVLWAELAMYERAARGQSEEVRLGTLPLHRLRALAADLPNPVHAFEVTQAVNAIATMPLDWARALAPPEISRRSSRRDPM